MKKIIFPLAVMLFLNMAALAQLSSINTTARSAIKGYFKTFVVLDENSGFVLAKTPITYQAGAKMPLCYFTTVLPNGADSYVPGNPRVFIIHSTEVVSNSAQQDWVLENNTKENDIFFARNKYINNVLSKHWQIMVDGQMVVFKNIRTGEFLTIDNQGKYHATKNFSKATRWKLIYTF